MLITFEGPEGAGKTTQIGRLADRLAALGHSVVSTRQPGGTDLGAALRHILLDRSSIAIDPLSELLTMMADRAQSVAEVIRPALARGEIVLCDRYADSSMAYQGYGRGIDLGTVAELNTIATAGLVPDLSFLLDIEPEIGLARQQSRNRMESLDIGFHRRVRAGFLEIAGQSAERFAIIDADRTVIEVAADIWRAYEAHHRHCA